jgi:crotonobetaine/carnitine-CoA ligase
MGYRFPDIHDRTLPRLLAHQVEHRGSAPFLQFGGGVSITFSGIDELSNRIAAGLKRLGVGKGDRVAMLLPNCEEFVPIWFAAAKLGAIEAPINSALKETLLAYVLKDCRSSILVCHSSTLENVARALGGDRVFEHVVIVAGSAADVQAAGVIAEHSASFEEIANEQASSLPIDLVAPSDPMAILYTSGTTGASKGVILPHHQYYLWAERMVASMHLTADDTYYTPLPLFHGDAQFFGVYFPLVYGARGAVYARFSASRYWDQVRECGATATNMLGAIAHILWRQTPDVKDKQNGIRVCQAIPMVSMRHAFEERFGLTLVTAYGQTETSLVTYDTPERRKSGTCGRVDPDFDVAVVDEFDTFLPSGTVGEIVIRSKQPWSMFLGYFQKSDYTVQAWRNLWFHTGDKGYLDEAGWLYFSGRTKDVIRRRGENVSAQEIEAIVEEHASVAECAAIAVSSELSEDDIKVIVVRRNGACLSHQELWDFCNARMPHFMVPRYIEFFSDALPRTPTEKIAKEQLRAREETGHIWDHESPPERKISYAAPERGSS